MTAEEMCSPSSSTAKKLEQELTLTHTDLVEGSQEARLLAGEAVSSLDGGDGALHVARHQQLRQLQQTVAKHEELQTEEEERSESQEAVQESLGGHFIRSGSY